MSATAQGVRIATVAVTMTGLLAGLGGLPARADTMMTATTGVNIRSKPSTSSKVVGGLYRGQTVTAVSTSGNWIRIKFGSHTGYVYSKYLRKGDQLPTNPGVSQTRVTTTNVNLRTGPGMSYDKRTTVPKGTSVTLTGKAARGYSEVKFGSLTGWIATQYLTAPPKPGSTLPQITGTRITTAKKLTLRSSPNKKYTKRGTLPKGTLVSITGVTKNKRAQIVYRNSVLWVTAKYLAMPPAGPTTPTLPKVTGVRYATAVLNIRSTPNDDYKLIAEVAIGTQLNITGVVTNGRMQIIYDNAVRWVTAQYLSTTKPTNPYYAVERGLKPNAIKVHRAVRATFPQITSIGGVRPDPLPDHPSGRALDLMIPNYKTAAGKAFGEKVALWAKAHAKEYGINYVIWNQHIWNIERDKEGWRYMANRGSDSANHKNHVHITVYG